MTDIPLGSPSAPARRRASPTQEILAAIAATRVLTRRLAQGTRVDPRRLRLLARAWVRAAETGEPAFLGLTALALGQRAVAGRAAQIVMLALATAREMTMSRAGLTRLALTALLADIGEPRARGADVEAEPAAQARVVPAATAAVVVRMFGAGPEALHVADAAFEAAWVRRQRALGKLERGGLEPHVAARVLHVVRAYLDRVAPADGTEPSAPLEAIVQIGALRTIDPAVYRCLIHALGSTPAGGVVELASGEWAIVLPPATASDPHDRPRLRVLTDPGGRPYRPAVELDLADPAHRGRRIARLVDPTDVHAFALAAFADA